VAGRCRPCDQRRPKALTRMGKRQRDCVDCGAPVGIIGRQHCCRCVGQMREQAAKASCPDCGKDRVLVEATGRCVLCSRRCTSCGHPVRRADTRLCKTCRANPSGSPSNDRVHVASDPDIHALKQGGAVRVPDLGRPSNRPASAASAASCGGMPDSGCAHRAGNAIRIARSSVPRASLPDCRNHRPGWASSPPMWLSGSVPAERPR
jgi:hypothetical protein